MPGKKTTDAARENRDNEERIMENRKTENNPKRGTIIGIDLGTATTEAAVFRDGKPVMICGFDGSVVTPSAVGVDESGNLVIGERAKAQFIMAPERTVIEVKRKMGTDERISMGRQTFSPVELSAMLLEYVKRYASQYLDEDIDRAVISVPAYFDDLQRQAVVEAGKKAGFAVERIINEPTAAALSYGIDHLEEESNILIYDLGGGTFDVTLLELFDGVLEVKASSGDNQLGGKDFDERLVSWLRSRFEEKNGVSLEGNVHAMARLKEQAEKCKVALSSQDQEIIHIPFLAEKDGLPLALEETVTRLQFEELIEDLVDRTHDPIQVVLDDGKIKKEDLDLILLVGGSTRVPLVARDIEAFLGMEPKGEIDPDYSVAMGAAIQAGIIAGVVDSDSSIIMTDVNPYTLGIRTIGNFSDDFMSVIIPRNVTIPVTRHQVYYTVVEGQRAAEIEIYQGESRTASRNHLLGKFTIDGIPAAPAGDESIDVAFSYNQNGMLSVTAALVSTGKEMSVTIDMMAVRKEERVDVSRWKSSAFAGDYRSAVRRAEKAVKDLNREAGEDSRSMAGELEELVYRLKKAVMEEDLDEADRLDEEIHDFMEEI